MHADYQRLMAEATRLTQSGDLRAATASIQQALLGNSPMPPAGAAARETDNARTIDVVARTVAETPAPTDARPPAPGSSTSAKTEATASGQFVAGSHAHPTAGQRSYKLFVPPQHGPVATQPLIVMLHGCTQDPDDFARGTAMNEAAERKGWFVLYPAQSADMNPQRCWNWFKHTHQQRERGEPAVLAGMVRDVIAQHPSIDPARVYVAGLSAGGAMAAILGETYPDLFAAVGVHSGLAAGAANDMASAFGAMQNGGQAPAGLGSRMPTIVFHGDADHTVNIKNAQQVMAASIGTQAGLQSEAPTAAGGSRKVTRQVLRDGANGKTTAEFWTVHGAPHAWSGGRPAGTFTDPSGPDATAQMLRFFEQHSQTAKR